MRDSIPQAFGWTRRRPASASARGAVAMAEQSWTWWHVVVPGLAMTLAIAAFLKVGSSNPLSSIGGVQSVYEPLLLLATTMLLLVRTRFSLPVSLLERVPLLSLFAYGMYAMTSSLWSPSPLLSFAKSFELLVVALSGVLIVEALHGAGMGGRLYGTLTVAILAAIASFVLLNTALFGNPFHLQYTDYDGRSRLWLAYTHPIDVGDLAALGFLSALVSALPARARVGLMLLFGALLVATAARGSEVGVVVGVVFWVVLRKRSGARLGWRMLALGGFLIAAGAAALWLAVNNDSIVTLIPQETLTLDGRLGLWSTALDLSLRDATTAVFGYGYYATRFLLLETYQWGGHTHQVFLEVLFTTGLIGLVLFFCFAVSSSRLAARSRGLLVMLPYFAVVSFDNPVLFQPSVEMVIATIVVGDALRHAAVATSTPPVRRRRTNRLTRSRRLPECSLLR